MIVVAAVIERDGCILIGQRRRNDRHPFKWEFPGGKVEAGETPRQALARELTEELNIRAVIGDEVTRYTYRYPNRPIFELIFYSVTEFSGQPENRAFETTLWAEPKSLTTFDFLDGDIDFVRTLARRGQVRPTALEP